MLPLGWAVQFPVIDWGYSCISTNVVAIFGQKGQLKLAPKTHHVWKTTGILPSLEKHISPGTKNMSPKQNQEKSSSKMPNLQRGYQQNPLGKKSSQNFSSFSLKLNSQTPRKLGGEDFRAQGLTGNFGNFEATSCRVEKLRTLCPWKPISRLLVDFNPSDLLLKVKLDHFSPGRRED